MKYLGIDPGGSGGIAIIETTENGAGVFAGPVGDTLRDTYETILRPARTGNGPMDCFAFIERVSAMPNQGVSSTFTFGRSYGNLEAFLVAAGIPFDYVSPAVWQRELGIQKIKDEPKVAKKNRHKELAQRLFPNIKITHAIADALLIAEYGRRARSGASL